MIAEMTQADVVTIAAAARATGAHTNTIRSWIARGDLQAVQTPLGRVVLKESLDAFLAIRAERQSETVER